MAIAKPVKRKKKNRVLTSGQVHVQATYNNTIVTLCDVNGDVVAWASAGIAGFKGPKKATPYAAGVIVRNLLDKVADCGLREVNVFIKGVGSGREAAIRALSAQGINILSIKDVTPIPHNGPRPRKPRRV
ncbi:30S ribosomal protein S11 [Patescibacteria group bacterium]|nr:30S ribosomal protein S11 [Patescibacteria group bacterium]